jgi:hypothetical protein
MIVGACKYLLRRPKAREDSCSDGEQSVPPRSAPAIGKREQEKIVTRAFACSSSAARGSRTAVLLNYASVFARRVAQNRARRCHRREMARYDYALADRSVCPMGNLQRTSAHLGDFSRFNLAKTCQFLAFARQLHLPFPGAHTYPKIWSGLFGSVTRPLPSRLERGPIPRRCTR